MGLCCNKLTYQDADAPNTEIKRNESGNGLCPPRRTMDSYNNKLSNFKRVDGPWSWIMCILLLVSKLVAYGCVATSGIFFPGLLQDLKSSRAGAAIPGSFAIANIGLMGPLNGMLCDHFGSRKVLIAGSLTCSIGLIASSFVPNITVLIVTYGIVLGSAVGSVYSSSMVAVPIYFDKYKFEATSIISVSMGSALVVMSPVVQNLNRDLEWRGSFLVMSGFCIIPFVVSLLMRSAGAEQLETSNRRHNQNNLTWCSLGKLIYCSAFRIKLFSLMTFMAAVSCLGHSMPLVHLDKFSEDINIDSTLSSWLYFIIGVGSTTSRLFVGKIGKACPFSLPMISLLGNILLAVGNVALPSISEFYGLVLYSIGYGVGDGLLLTPAINIVVESVPDEERGRAFGLYQLITFLQYILGPILAGWIADVSGSYNTAFYTAGSLEIFAGCLCILSRFIHSKIRDLINVDNDFETHLVVIDKETVL